MKINSIHFLSKSNIKGNKNSGTITLLICLLTVAITVISCFSVTTVNTVNKYENDYRARALYLSPFLKPLTDDALQAIDSIEHVESIVDLVGLKGDNLYCISKTDSDSINEKMLYCDTELHINGLNEGENLGVIKGNSLDDSPIFSCLVPSLFYPFSDANENNFENLEYIDGTTLIGKTITVIGYNNTLSLDYFSYENENFNQLYREFSSPEFTFTVVGTYPCSYATTGSFIELFVSKETDLLMAEMTFEGAGICH